MLAAAPLAGKKKLDGCYAYLCMMMAFLSAALWLGAPPGGPEVTFIDFMPPPVCFAAALWSLYLVRRAFKEDTKNPDASPADLEAQPPLVIELKAEPPCVIELKAQPPSVIEPDASAAEAEPPSVIEEAEGACNTDDIIFKPNFRKFVVVTKESIPVRNFLQGCDAKPVLERQKDAVRLYTGNSVYQNINQALRKDDGEGLKTYGSLINLTMQPFSFYAMQQLDSLLKPFVGTVWRGCSLSKHDELKYHAGNVVCWEGFSSTSKKKASAFGGNFIFEIHCNKCLMAVQRRNGQNCIGNAREFFVPACIQHLSQYPSEDEVLYPPYTKFRVVHRNQKPFGKVHVVMETKEFSSLSKLVQQGKWDKVQEGIKIRKQNATHDSPAWFTQHQEQEGSLFEQIAEKVVSEGPSSSGLQVVAQMQELGADPQKAHDVLKSALMDSHVPLPDSHSKWYFEATLMNPDDKQLADRIHTEDGTPWQAYSARQSTILEKWYVKGHQGEVKFTVVNNIGKEAPYVVWMDHSGQMYQKAVGGGMIGNHRRILRATTKK